MNDEPVDVLGYLLSLRRFLLPALIVGLLGAALGYLLTPRAEAESTFTARSHVLVQITGSQPGTDVATLIPYVIRTYQAVEDAPEVINATAQKLGDVENPDDLIPQTQTYWGGGGLIMALRGQGDTEARAKQVSDAFTEAFVAEAPKLVSFGTVQATFKIVQRAQVLDAPAPKPGRSPLASAAGVGIAGFLLTLLALELLARQRSRRRP